MIEITHPGDFCQHPVKRATDGRGCYRSASWRIDGKVYCWQHAMPLIAGREYEIRDVVEGEETERERAYRLRLDRGEPGLVYVIQPYGLTPAPLKIGYTTNHDSLPGRLEQLQTSHWHRLEVVGLRRGTVAQERHVHRQLRAHWIRGEWFWPHPDVMRVFCACTEPLVEEGAA